MNTRLRTRFHLVAAAAAVLLTNCTGSEKRDQTLPDAGADAEAVAPDTSVSRKAQMAADNAGIEASSGWRPWTRDASFAGKTLDELAVDWAHWNLSQSDCIDNPESDIDGALCRLNQANDSAVFFVAPGDYLTVRSQCTVRAEQAMVVPLAYFYADGVSSPIGPNTPTDMLEKQARSIQETMRDLVLVVDGEPIDSLEALAVGPLKFSQDLPRSGNYYECSGYEDVTSPVDPIYLAGYFALLPPPGPGKHRLVFGGTYSYLGWDFVKRVNFTFSAE